jgi:hypothetical protein
VAVGMAVATRVGIRVSVAAGLDANVGERDGVLLRKAVSVRAASGSVALADAGGVSVGLAGAIIRNSRPVQ